MSNPDSPRSSIVIQTFLALFFGAILLAGASGAYLYLNWEKHFPPMAELQDQVRTARAIKLAELGASAVEGEQAEEEEPTGMGAWLDQLSSHAEEQADESPEQIEDKFANARIEQEAAEDAADPFLVAQQDLENFLPEKPSAQEQAKVPSAPASPISPGTPANPNAKPLERGGTIEKMKDDWLPPGVTRTK